MRYFIDIYDSNKNKLKMEVVMKFNLEGYRDNYLIYKEINEDNYFIAKYIGENMVDLDTDLTKSEIELAEKLLERFLSDET